MGRDDWYRNTAWNAETEAAFRAKLARSRNSRPQYLRIQADCLAEHYPTTALALIDEYFATGDDFDIPNAWCVRARAYQACGDITEAVAAYKQALAWEERHPRHLSTARMDLPKLVAETRLSREYDYALDILASRFTALDHQFPNTRYVWNGSCALITCERGQIAEAREFAERALRAAAETESPFRYHRGVGLVTNTADDFGRRVERIARPSRLRSLFRLFSNS